MTPGTKTQVGAAFFHVIPVCVCVMFKQTIHKLLSLLQNIWITGHHQVALKVI